MNKAHTLIKKNCLIQKNDVLLFAGLIVLALVLLLLIPLFTKNGGNTVCVTLDGKPYISRSLAENCEFSVHGVSGDNHICIRDGSVSVTSADCPDLICVHHTPIRNAGERIVCLPNRVVISITNDSSAPATPDAISQ